MWVAACGRWEGTGAHHERLADMELDEEDLGLQAQHVALLAHLDAVAVVQVRVHPALVAQHYRRCVPASHNSSEAQAWWGLLTGFCQLMLLWPASQVHVIDVF